MYAEYSKAPKSCMSKIDTKIIVHNTQSPIVILEACQNYKSVVIDTLIRCVLQVQHYLLLWDFFPPLQKMWEIATLRNE